MMPTDDEIRRVLAEKLMGMKPIEGFYYYGDDTWNPLRNIEQAMMCAEKVFMYGKMECFLGASDKPYRFTGKTRADGNWFDWGYSKNPAEVISRACYEAVKEGW